MAVVQHQPTAWGDGESQARPAKSEPDPPRVGPTVLVGNVADSEPNRSVPGVRLSSAVAPAIAIATVVGKNPSPPDAETPTVHKEVEPLNSTRNEHQIVPDPVAPHRQCHRRQHHHQRHRGGEVEQAATHEQKCIARRLIRSSASPSPPPASPPWPRP